MLSVKPVAYMNAIDKNNKPMYKVFTILSYFLSPRYISHYLYIHSYYLLTFMTSWAWLSGTYLKRFLKCHVDITQTHNTYCSKVLWPFCSYASQNRNARLNLKVTATEGRTHICYKWFNFNWYCHQHLDLFWL